MIPMRTMLRLAAVFVMALTTAVAVSGWLLLGGLERLGASSLLSSRTFDTLHQTLDVTVETTATVRGAMADLDRLVELTAASSATTAQFVDDAADITSNRIAESLGAIERAMPGLIDAGTVIDDTLSTLSLFGVDYRPEVPFDEALRDIQASLDGLSDDVAAQGATMRTLVPEVVRVGETSLALAERIRETGRQLATAEVLLGEYRAILTGAEESVGSTSSPLQFTNVARGLLVVIGLVGAALGVAMWKLAPALEAVAIRSHFDV